MLASESLADAHTICVFGIPIVCVDYEFVNNAPVGDNASAELVDLARAGDREGFRALASCLMPVKKVDECWSGTRKRLKLEAE